MVRSVGQSRGARQHAQGHRSSQRVLKAGVAIAGFPAIIPSRILRESPGGIIGIGIVGYGIRSKNLLYQFLNAPGTRVVGIAEVVDARRGSCR